MWWFALGRTTALPSLLSASLSKVSVHQKSTACPRNEGYQSMLSKLGEALTHSCKGLDDRD